MVLVQMSVKVSDVERFMAAKKRFDPLMAEMGAREQRVLEDENESGLMTLLSEWDSHDTMHAASERYGDEFNAAAGTEGLEWETHIWQGR